jgi:hypothetical protein
MKVKNLTMQAFPFIEPNEDDNIKAYHPGISLIDYFAAHALQGLLANPKLQKEILAQGGCQSGWIETSAWAFADEMMKARK